ncbi:hypothetical protein AVEN_204876-1 [Araneus ventricosus]|uniref:Uncharacterized protein n=1 Tax=Araneus ventricosus TaxID=182803 RepID=A0A4Y2UIK6_ARAVE|nr:hypothetical protein AVEN_204876-1 [Araneus ventricosus]
MNMRKNWGFNPVGWRGGSYRNRLEMLLRGGIIILASAFRFTTQRMAGGEWVVGKWLQVRSPKSARPFPKAPCFKGAGRKVSDKS